MLGDVGASARCAEGHSFDYARSGYLNLVRRTGRRARVGDTPAMVQARAELLAAGHYDRLTEAVARAAAAAAPTASVLAELGSGTGHYLAASVDRLRELGRPPECAFGFDLSKAAAAHSARRRRDIGFVVADVEALIPLRDSAADVVLSVFAPRPAPELARVVRREGELVAAFAGPRHLERLRERLDLIGVREQKLDRLAERLRPAFELVAAVPLEYEVELTEEDARHAVLMGPNARHDHALARLDGPLGDLVSVFVSRFRRVQDA